MSYKETRIPHLETERRTVLVVDDSALVRHVVCDLIAGYADFTVIGTASDGLDALAKVHMLDPDIVTLDIEVPGIDGIAALGYIMSEAPGPLLFLRAVGWGGRGPPPWRGGNPGPGALGQSPGAPPGE